MPHEIGGQRRQQQMRAQPVTRRRAAARSAGATPGRRRSDGAPDARSTSSRSGGLRPSTPRAQPGTRVGADAAALPARAAAGPGAPAPGARAVLVEQRQRRPARSPNRWNTVPFATPARGDLVHRDRLHAALSKQPRRRLGRARGSARVRALRVWRGRDGQQSRPSPLTLPTDLTTAKSCSLTIVKFMEALAVPLPAPRRSPARHPGRADVRSRRQ